MATHTGKRTLPFNYVILAVFQRGRNAVVFALDKSNREVPLEIIQYMMQNGVYLADRDMVSTALRHSLSAYFAYLL